MSAADSDYLDTYDPNGNVLRFWHEKWHCNSKVKSNASTEQTKQTTLDCIKRLERFLASEPDDCHWMDIDIPDEDDEAAYDDFYNDLDPLPRNVTPQVAEEFLIEMVENSAADTQQTTFATLSQAYDWCEPRVVPVDVNPFKKVKEKWKEEQGDWLLESPEGRDPYIVPLKEARNVVRAWDSFRWRTVQLVFAKYPRRAGAVSNLDTCDVHIDHPGCEWEVHPEIRRWPDHILFRAEKRAAEKSRNTGNKTKTTAKYPIDEELKQFLLTYLARRHTITSPGDPLFFSTQGNRLSGGTMSNRFIGHAKEQGHFYGADDDDNFNPHYWRHWGTSWYEDQFSGDKDTEGYTPLTDYLRGDSRQEIKALYNNYTESKRDRILKAMPTFFEPFIDN
jgi:integrase